MGFLLCFYAVKSYRLFGLQQEDDDEVRIDGTFVILRAWFLSSCGFEKGLAYHKSA